MERISLIHGEGGKHTQTLVKEIFYKEFKNETLLKDRDSANLTLNCNEIAFTTDSFVVKPLFFNGGDIGKLAVCGTVNDLVTSFSIPKFLSLSFIIEDGFFIKDLRKIVKSISETSDKAGVRIVTGDTKVIERGKIDGIFINTSGIGLIKHSITDDIKVGDKIIITSTIGEHGTDIAMSRYGLEIEGDIKSDVSPLNDLVEILYEHKNYIRLLKDPTRGGIAQSLNEISQKYKVGIEIIEENIPIREEVKSLNEMIGLDPYYLACEGVMIIIVENKISKNVINKLKTYEKYSKAEIVGEVIEENKVYIKNKIGGKRIVRELESIMLPRIC